MSLAEAIVRERCPRCREGTIYRKPLLRGWLAMNERCSRCGLRFSRGSGYFVGAMYVSYALSLAPILLLFFLFWRVVELRYEVSLLAAAIGFLPLAPLTVRLSRVIWIYVDQALDPE